MPRLIDIELLDSQCDGINQDMSFLADATRAWLYSDAGDFAEPHLVEGFPDHFLSDPPSDYVHEPNARRYLALLESFAVPTAVCGDGAALLTTNHLMGELLAVEDGLHAKSGILKCAISAERELLVDLIRLTREDASGGDSRRCRSMTVTRNTGKPGLALIVSPLCVRVPIGQIPPSPEALVRVMMPERRRVIDPVALAKIFHLTKSEAALSVALTNSGNLMRAAALCGLTVGSARQYLKRIFTKTGTSGQVELVTLILQVSIL